MSKSNYLEALKEHKHYWPLAALFLLFAGLVVFANPGDVTGYTFINDMLTANETITVGNEDVTEVVESTEKKTPKEETPEEAPLGEITGRATSSSGDSQNTTQPNTERPDIARDALDQRQNDTEQAQPPTPAVPSFVDAPAAEELPPMRGNIPEHAKVSRGRDFVAGGQFVQGENAKTVYNTTLPINSTARLYQKNILNAIHSKGFETGEFTPDVKVRVMVVHKFGASNSSLPKQGETYGNILITNLSLREMDQYNMGAGPDSPYELVALDEKTEISIQEADQRIQGPLARNVSGSRGNVGICVIDTGIDYYLQELSDNYVQGVDFVNNDEDPMDDNGHGTKMVDAITTIAPEANLYIAKALDENGEGWSSDVIRAIDWCMQQNVSVISMSLGSGEYKSWCDEVSLMAQKANEAVARGFFVASASGNIGHGGMMSPACGSMVTSVGASDETEDTTEIWDTSGLTNVTDILSPGVEVELLTLGGTRTGTSGTSVSTAILSGSSAVVFEDTQLGPEDLQNRLRSTGILINSSFNNKEYPRIDSYRAITNKKNNLTLEQEGYQSQESSDPSVTAQACSSVSVDCSTQTCPTEECQGEDYCTFTSCFSDTCSVATQTSCDGTENHTCDLEADGCGGSCTDGEDNDGDGDPDECDTDCTGFECSASGQCCTNTCTYKSAGEGGCPSCQRCTGSSGSCQNAFEGGEDSEGSNLCEAACNECSSGSCVTISFRTDDTAGNNQCSGSTGCTAGDCTCDGNGDCDFDRGEICSGSPDCVDDNPGTSDDIACKDNVFEGGVENKRCVPDSWDYCVTDSSSPFYFSAGSTVSGNTCEEANGDVTDSFTEAVWVADSGRWVLKNNGGTTLAVVDKYGTMVTLGADIGSSTDSGWKVEDNTGTVQIVINSSNGELYSGAISQRVTPSGTGYKIQNSTGGLQALFQTNGEIELRGDYANDADSIS